MERIIIISDPEWAPFWTNYKYLKKVIKELPSIPSRSNYPRVSTSSFISTSSLPTIDEMIIDHSDLCYRNRHQITHSKSMEIRYLGNNTDLKRRRVEEIGTNPGEIIFFKLLHTELKKAEHFFERAQVEFTIREERVRESVFIIKRSKSMMVDDRWSFLAKSVYRLYKDLLLLETFAIMTYCSFSKILKKHDKVTGYRTRNAFMENVVNKANFTNYPTVLQMIAQCQTLYTEVSDNLLVEGNQTLCEDEHLFLNQIQRLNAQILQKAVKK